MKSTCLSGLILAAILVLSGCANTSAVAQPTLTSPTQVDTIAERGDVQAALAAIVDMNERNIERLISLNEVAAPPFEEDKRARVFADRLIALGIEDVTIDAVGNVVARRAGQGEGPTVAVVAHLDTVFPPWTNVTVQREGNVFTAPGIGDNTRGLVVVLAMVEAMEAHGLETVGDVLFIGSVGEEGLGDLRGVRHLFTEEGDVGIDSFIAIDGGRLDRVVTQAVGSHRYKVTFEGPGGHSYGAFGRAHPHQALAQAIARFTDLATPVTETPGAPATFSVGRIGGGTSINSIPFASWMEVDMRSTDQAKLDQLDAAFQQAVAEALEVENDRRRIGEAMTVNIEQVGLRPAGQTDPDSSLVQNAAAALAQIGTEAQFTASSTDANIPMSVGVPAITISRGGISRNAHAPNESWENVDAHLAIQAALLTLLAEAGLAQ